VGKCNSNLVRESRFAAPHPPRAWHFPDAGAICRLFYPTWDHGLGNLKGDGKLNVAVCSRGTSPAMSGLSLSLPSRVQMINLLL
jgi:hypothetical protein